VLELLANCPEGLPLVEMAGKLKIPANSVFRIALTLERLGYIARNEKTRKYTLTRRLLSVGCTTVHESNIVEVAMDCLRKFRDDVKETAALAILLPAEARGLVLAQATSSHPFGYRLEIGTRFDLHCTGPGKALVAFLPAEELERIVDSISFTRYNSNTITSKGAFLRELERVRKDGYALDREENMNGCFCVSAPVFDENGYPVAAIWATGPSNRPIAVQCAAVGRKARDYASKISRRLAGAGS